MVYLLLTLFMLIIVIKYNMLAKLSLSLNKYISWESTNLDSTKVKISNSLTHNDLIRLMERFDYKPGGGICFGFTLTWAQDVVAVREAVFYERLNLVRNEKAHFASKLGVITRKIRSHQLINQQENQLLEVKSFIEAVCIAQSPNNYEELYNKRLTQTNVDNIINIAQQGLICGDLAIKRVFTKTVAFSTSSEVIQYFKYLAFLIQKFDNLAIVISNERHSIGLKKDVRGWLLLDINYLYRQSPDYPYLILNDEQLSYQLNTSFNEQAQFIINFDFIALDNLTLRKQLAALNDMFPVTHKHFLFKNSREVSFIAICAQSGDEQSIAELVKLHNSRRYLLTPEEIRTALEFAIDGNQMRILTLLMYLHGFDINMACLSDGTTALGLACEFGNLSLVKLLLTHTCINVDATNCNGDTPLMLACKKSKKSMELITVLLEAGASVIKENDRHQNALAIAKVNDNYVAISAIRIYERSKCLTDIVTNRRDLSLLEGQYPPLSTLATYGYTFFTSQSPAAPIEKAIKPESLGKCSLN
ncbi:ankyrin repeat domain-containing protein [Legionella sp. D16C41]|uniref:ankyrin repeat domain-containing protein n=1 Tax=Legionella sp. D16C41 TaxID=3402688 RepID=UPI003AF57538